MLSHDLVRDSSEGGQINLAKYGYSFKNSDDSRRHALNMAIKKNNLRNVYYELYILGYNLPESNFKSIVGTDVAYLKQLYRQKGGTENDSDVKFEIVNLSSSKKQCVNGKCDSKDTVYEKYQVNYREIIFRSLTADDEKEINRLDIKYLESGHVSVQIAKKLDKYASIGIIVDGILRGYCKYKFIGDCVKIEWFYAGKSYRTPLFQFIEKYFSANNYNKIIIIVSLKGFADIYWLKFWNKMGFVPVAPDKKTDTKLYMSKNI